MRRGVKITRRNCGRYVRFSGESDGREMGREFPESAECRTMSPSIRNGHSLPKELSEVSNRVLKGHNAIKSYPSKCGF